MAGNPRWLPVLIRALQIAAFPSTTESESLLTRFRHRVGNLAIPKGTDTARMHSETEPGRARLTGANAARADVDQRWEQDNQAWWDWYVSLGDSSIDVISQADTAPIEAVLDAEMLRPEIAGDTELDELLATPYPLTEAHREFFGTNGYVKLSRVLTPRAVCRLRLEMVRCFKDEFAVDPDTDGAGRFLSIEMAWLGNPVIRRYVLSPRIARLSAELLDVDAVRLYHDNLLAKQAGCGRTPWHYDRHHFPIATDNIVTAWIPAQTIAASMGPLTFAGPVDAHTLVHDIEFDKFGTSYDRRVDDVFRRNSDRIHVAEEEFEIGDVSFHHSLCFHSAGPNRTRFSRMALANTYFADGSRLVDKPTMVSGDWQKFMPGVAPGEVVDSDYNPVCWSSMK